MPNVADRKCLIRRHSAPTIRDSEIAGRVLERWGSGREGEGEEIRGLL